MNLKYTLINLFSNVDVNEPVRLQKQKTKMDIKIELNDLIQRNFYIICALAIIFLLVVFVICCFMIVGISATDSGMVYNNIQKVI